MKDEGAHTRPVSNERPMPDIDDCQAFRGFSHNTQMTYMRKTLKMFQNLQVAGRVWTPTLVSYIP